jgi:hypothetical protein
MYKKKTARITLRVAIPTMIHDAGMMQEYRHLGTIVSPLTQGNLSFSFVNNNSLFWSF